MLKIELNIQPEQNLSDYLASDREAEPKSLG